MKIFQCQACDQPLTFENTSCESCQRRLGYLCEIHELSALEPHGEPPHRVWHAYAAPGRKYRFCANEAHGAEAGSADGKKRRGNTSTAAVA